MHRAVVAIGTTLGVLAVLGTGLWWMIAMAFGAFDRDGPQIILLLFAGPLTLLPASIVGRKHPVSAGLWLVSAAIFCFFWHLGVILNDGFRQLFTSEPSLEAWLPIALICTPMQLVGSAFLWTQRATILETTASRFRSPVFRRRFLMVTAAAAGSAIFWLGILRLQDPAWKITVRAGSRLPRSMHLDPRQAVERRADLEWVFKELFEPLGPGTTVVLGTTELSGDVGGGTSTWTVERNPAGLMLVLRDGTPVDRNWMAESAALSNAHRFAVRATLQKAARYR